MKNLSKWAILLAALAVCIITLVSAMFVSKGSSTKLTKNEMLDFYKHYGYYTNPGEYEKLYNDLPDILPELCKLIKAQLIHPLADLPMYRDVIPSNRIIEDDDYVTTKEILAGLVKYNPAGLILERKPEQRLLLTCRYHSILLASILKHKNIPVRVRYGFANYLFPGSYIYHVICEVWNEKETRWMLVDPDRKLVDFPRERFEFVNDVWIKYKQGKIDASQYGVINWWGADPILSVLCHDAASVLGNEYMYTDQPEVLVNPNRDVGKIPKDQIDIINKVAALLKDPDTNFNDLRTLYNNTKILKFSSSKNNPMLQ